MLFEQHPVLQEFDRLNNSINEFYHEICVTQGFSDSAEFMSHTERRNLICPTK
mgnify:CR=1 FL=1